MRHDAGSEASTDQTWVLRLDLADFSECSRGRIWSTATAIAGPAAMETQTPFIPDILPPNAKSSATGTMKNASDVSLTERPGRPMYW